MAHTPGPWYNATKKDSLQGLIYSEATGANIAVTYNPDDSAIVAAAHELLKELVNCIELLQNDAPQSAWDAIHKAKGE